MKSLHDNQFPNESDEYRKARNELLEAEIDLRRQTEKVASIRRSLPLGGKLKEDYVFTGLNGNKTKLSSLFEEGKQTLVIYSMMFDKTADEPCIMCNSIVDGLNGNARQITQKVNLAIIGKAPIEKLRDYAIKANWQYIQLLSSHDNTYNADYFGEGDEGQRPMINVFTKKNGDIYHTWGSEMALLSGDPGQDERAIDIIWPLYNVLDLTPEGREKFYPKILNRNTGSSCGDCGDCNCK